MPTDSDLYELLYVSLMAPPCEAGAVASIAQESRARNAVCGITGLLVFDGEAFCQQLEGAAFQVRTLFARIEVDPRHSHVRVLHEGGSARRRFLRFSMGFAQVEGGDLLTSLGTHAGPGAMAAFSELLPFIDMEP